MEPLFAVSDVYCTTSITTFRANIGLLASLSETSQTALHPTAVVVVPVVLLSRLQEGPYTESDTRAPNPPFVAGFFESLFSKSGDVDSIDSEIIQAASLRGQWDAAFDMSGATVTALSPDEKTGTSFPFRITFEGVFVLSVSVIDACDKDSPQRSLFLTANTAESRWESSSHCFCRMLPA